MYYILWALCVLTLSNFAIIDEVIAEERRSVAEHQVTRPPVNLRSLSAEQKKEFKDSFDTIISDCDGVLFNPNGTVKNVPRAINQLIEQGKSIYYVSNTVTTKRKLLDRLEELGYTGIAEESIVTSGSSLLEHLRANLAPGKAVYLLGPPRVCDELLRHGIPCFGPGRDEMDDGMVENITRTEIKMREDVGAVVIERDIFINYLKILKAFKYLKNPDCLFIAMNTDETFISSYGAQLPSTGVILAAIKKASRREPFISGKPGTHLRNLLATMAGDPQRTLFVGDKLGTDILMGRKCSFRTLFVLTGVDSLDDVEKYAKSQNAEERMCIPDYYTDSFSDLVFE